MQATDYESLQWWQKTIIYQVYPRSFQDSTGNGIGDLPGLTSRLDYFVDIGIGTIWLSPFYPSPQLDFGYDVSDFCDVDPMFGTLDDFDKLVKEAHERGLRIVVDFVGGHSSSHHSWFERSVKREEPYTNYYVWHDGKLDLQGNRIPPNNWLSVFTGSSWFWHPKRQQFYYRPFIPEQPKLNYRCQQVVEEMKNAIRFWFDRGVDGMRLDAVNELVEADDKSLDEPKSATADCPSEEYEYLDHVHTCLQPETFQAIKGWADVMEEYNKKDGKQRFMIAETYCEPKQRNMYRDSGVVPSNMDLFETLDKMGLSGETIKEAVDKEYKNLPANSWPTFVVGNHDRHRVSYRFGPVYCDAFNVLLLTLKGTPTTYYGEEIGMRDIQVSYEDTQDPFGKIVGPDRYQIFSRDPERSPMQWDNSSNAGFTSSSLPWLPVHPDHVTCNVQSQLACEEGSHLKLYKTLANLRKERAFSCGSLEYAFTNQEIFSYLREDKSFSSRYLVILNFGKNNASGHFSGHPVNVTHGVVEAAGSTVDKTAARGQHVVLDELVLKPGDCLVIKLDGC